ncbi:MAG TPA: helix-turn-helix transcriptional regulator [Rhodanobacter sp.]
MQSMPIRLPAQLGDMLRGARLSRGLTQTDIAKQLGISVQAVPKLENNAAKASFERIHRLCKAPGLELLLQEKSILNLQDAARPKW